MLKMKRQWADSNVGCFPVARSLPEKSSPGCLPCKIWGRRKGFEKPRSRIYTLGDRKEHKERRRVPDYILWLLTKDVLLRCYVSTNELQLQLQTHWIRVRAQGFFPEHTITTTITITTPKISHQQSELYKILWWCAEPYSYMGRLRLGGAGMFGATSDK